VRVRLTRSRAAGRLWGHGGELLGQVAGGDQGGL